MRAAAAYANVDAFLQDRLSRLLWRRARYIRARVARARSRRQQCADSAQSRATDGGQDDSRGVQCHAPARAVVQVAACGNGLQCRVESGAEKGARGNVPELSAADAPSVWLDGVAGAAAQARPDRCFVSRLTGRRSQYAATQSISMSKCPGHAGTLIKIRAGGFGPKKRA